MSRVSRKPADHALERSRPGPRAGRLSGVSTRGGRALRTDRVLAAHPGRRAHLGGVIMTNPTDATVHVRYLVNDVQAAIDFYTTHLGFTLNTAYLPAFADVQRGNLRLLLSGPTSSAGRPMPDGRVPQAGGWNRIHLIVKDVAA